MSRNRRFFAYFYAIRVEVLPDFVDLHKMEGGNREFFSTHGTVGKTAKTKR